MNFCHESLDEIMMSYDRRLGLHCFVLRECTKRATCRYAIPKESEQWYFFWLVVNERFHRLEAT